MPYSYTLGTLRTKLRSAIGNPSTSQVTNASLDEVLNDAYLEICDEFRFRKFRLVHTFDTIASTDTYALSNSVSVLLRVWCETDDERGRIARVDAREWADAGGSDSDITGRPTGYIRHEDSIQLVPMPDAVYAISYYAKVLPDELDDDADVPEIPPAWHPAMWKLARHLYWDLNGDAAKAQYAYNNYRLWISRKSDEWADELESEQEDGGPVPGMVVNNRRTPSVAQWERAL